MNAHAAAGSLVVQKPPKDLLSKRSHRFEAYASRRNAPKIALHQGLRLPGEPLPARGLEHALIEHADAIARLPANIVQLIHAQFPNDLETRLSAADWHELNRAEFVLENAEAHVPEGSLADAAV